jgi:hypothetical protein
LNQGLSDDGVGPRSGEFWGSGITGRIRMTDSDYFLFRVFFRIFSWVRFCREDWV